MLYDKTKNRMTRDMIRLPVPALPPLWCHPVETNSPHSCLSDRGGGAQGVKPAFVGGNALILMKFRPFDKKII